MKKLLVILMTLLMLVSCSKGSSNEAKKASAEYLNKLKTFETREKKQEQYSTDTVSVTPTENGSGKTFEIYHVVSGDTLGSIAGSRSVSVYDLALTNEIDDIDRIEVGQELKIPVYVTYEDFNGEYSAYQVVKGDTLFEIAQKYDTTVDFLTKANGIQNADLIEVGQELKVPVFTETESANQTGTDVATADDPDFEAFLDKVFKEGMEGDYMTLHFSVTDYKKLGLEKPPVDLGELKYGFDEENFKYFEDQLKELQSFDYDKLSYRQQYDYEALEYSLYETLADAAFYQYSFLFSSGSCLPENIVSNFTDFTFYDEESVEDYLTCLTDLDRYFDDALEYTAEQAKDGYGLLDVWIDWTQETCADVVKKTEDNAFITTFDERLASLDFLSAQQKEEYSARNKEIVLNEVLPAFSKVKDELEQYRGKTNMDDYALCNLDKDYAELTYMLMGSSNKPIEEVWQELKDNLDTLEAEYVSILDNPDSIAKYMAAQTGTPESFALNEKDTLEFLRNNLGGYYPELGDVDYDVDVLDPDTAPASAVAYYWSAPVDNPNQNIIRINPNHIDSGYSAYGTLAHEGFPGHLYQHVFYQRTNPHNFRSVIGFIGYTEGWAENAHRYALRYSGVDDDYVATAFYIDNSAYFPVFSIIDVGVNCFGWKAADIVKYFNNESQLFSFDVEAADQYRDIVIEMPGVYCSYGLGSSNFMTLENYAKNALGDRFDYVSYHETLLKNGPLPFNILQDAVDEYIASR